jgi:hypothetical protein
MSKKDVFEYLDYIDKLGPKEKEYIKKFYNEWYFADIYNEDADNIMDITDEEQRAKVIRNVYTRQNDVMGESSKAKVQYESDGFKKEKFMEAASDEWEWRDAFAQGGYELAVSFIFNQAIKDVNNPKVDQKVTLLRFYTKMTQLRRMKDRGTK